MKFHVFENIKDKIGTLHEHEWESLIEQGAFEHEITTKPKNKLDLVGFFTLKDQRIGRKENNVDQVTALGVDVDECTQGEFEVLVEHLQGTKVECVIYSTPSYTTEDNIKFRIIAPLTEPVDATKWPEIWEALTEKLLGPSEINYDKSCKNASRIYYTPHHSKFADEKGVKPIHIHIKGYKLSPNLYISKPKNFSAPVRGNKATKKSLESYVKFLEKDEPNCKWSTPLQAVVNGQAVGQKGDRYNTLRDLAMHVIATRFRDCTAESVVDVFEGTVKATHELNPDESYERFRGMFVRAVEDGYKKLEEEPQRRAEALQKLAEEQGRDPEAWLKEALIVVQNNIHFRLPDGSYSRHSFTKGSAPAIIRDQVMPQLEEFYDFYRELKSGRRMKTIDHLIEELATAVGSIEWTWLSSECELVLDDQGIPKLKMGLHKPSMVEPRYNEIADGWLRAFAGENYDLLVKWIALVQDLNHPLKALILHGPKSTGKSMLTNSIAMLLGSNAYLDAESWCGNFAPFERSPLIVAEEGVPEAWQGVQGLKEIKRFIAEKYKPLRRIYEAPTLVEGYYRLIVTANDTDLFKIGSDDLTSSSEEAIGERFLDIETGKEAIRYLRDLTEDERQYTYERGAAEHIAWIAEQNRHIRRSSRFGFESESVRITMMLRSQEKATALMIEWILKFLEKPNRFCAAPEGKKERLYEIEYFPEERAIGVTSVMYSDRDIMDKYGLLPKSVWTTNYIGKRLKRLSNGEYRRKRRGEKRLKYHLISLDTIEKMTEMEYDAEEWHEMATHAQALLEAARNTEAKVVNL